MALKEVTFENGAIWDVHPASLKDGYCSDARHVRFEDGHVMKMPGYAVYYDTANTYAVIGLHIFKGSDGHIYVMIGDKANILKVYNGTPTTLYDKYTGVETESVSADATPWSFANFGAYPIFTNGIDKPQIFASPYTSVGALSADAAMPAAADVVLVFQRHVVLLGQSANLQRVSWSDIDDYTTWTASSSNEAGDIDLYESKTRVVGGRCMGDYMVVFTENQIHLFQYIGGTNVFSRRVVEWNVGLWKKMLVTGVEEAIFFMSKDNFHMFDGARQKPIGDGIKRAVWALLNTSSMSRAFAYTNSYRHEAHFCVPTGSDVYPTLDCIYNWGNGTWSFDDIAMSMAVDRIPLSYPTFALATDKKLYALENTENAAGAAITGYVTSKEYGADEPDQIKCVTRIYPLVSSSMGSTAHLHFKVGYRNTSNAAVSWSSEFDFHPSASDYKMDVRSAGSGRLWSIKVYSDETGTPFTLSSLGVEVETLGSH